MSTYSESSLPRFSLQIAIAGKVEAGKVSGLAISLVNLMKAFESQGHKVTLWSTAVGSGESSTFAKCQVNSVKSLDPNEFDVVVIGGCFEPELWNLGARCRRSRTPYVVSPRSSLTRNSWRKSWWKKLLASPFLLRFLLGCTAVHFLSEEECLHSWRLPGGRYFIVPDVQECSDTSARWASKRKVIGFLGRLDISHKGLDMLVNAVAIAASELRMKGYTVELVGPDHRGDKDKLIRLVSQCSVDDLVHFIEPKLGHEKSVWLKEIRLFVHPSRYEGQPQSVFEAITAGAFPIVSTMCNMSPVIEKLGYGEVVSPTSQLLARALVHNLDAEFDHAPDTSWIRERYSADRIGSEFSVQLRKMLFL